jgi:hypothetical protein
LSSQSNHTETLLTCPSTRLEIIQQHMHPLCLDPEFLNDHARAPNNLPRISLPVDLAESRPGAEHLGVADLDEVDLVLGTEGFDEFGVLRFGARLDEDAEMRFALVEGFGTLAQPAGEPVMHEGVLQDFLYVRSACDLRSVGGRTHLESFGNRQFSFGCFGDNLNLRGVDFDLVSSVRHPTQNIMSERMAFKPMKPHFLCCEI